jgi:hypothetical protein
MHCSMILRGVSTRLQLSIRMGEMRQGITKALSDVLLGYIDEATDGGVTDGYSD